MKKTLKLVFDGQVFQPEEPVDLTSNTCYFAIIEKIEEGLKRYLTVLLDEFGNVLWI